MTQPNTTVDEQVFDLDSTFDNAGGGSGAPSFEWPSELVQPGNKVVPVVGGSIAGTITDIFATVVKDANTREPKLNKKGQQMPQFNLTLQTNLRNWEGCKKIPLIDPNDPNSGQKPASEDTGERRIYVKFKMLDAIAAAIKTAGQVKANGQIGGGPRVGAKVAVKVSKLENTGAPNPLPHYEARYVLAPTEAPTDDAWASATTTEQPAQAVQGAQPPAGDPWSKATTFGQDEPPF